MTVPLELHAKHFNATPWAWSAARPHVKQKIAGTDGGQGAIFRCSADYEGAVAKLYNKHRTRADLRRVQQLIKVCSSLDNSQPATSEWFRRLNLPMRPIVSDDQQFIGVILPPLPETVNVPEYRFDAERSKLVRTSAKVRFEAQFLAKKISPVGATTEVWQWRILHSLAETVALMHSANLVHGDLSLNNVLAQSLGDSHARDHVYLIDIDDAFLDSSSDALPTVVRQSRLAFDPYSLAVERVSKQTDVFVVALWVVALMQYKFTNPEAVAREVPQTALTRLRRVDPKAAEIVRKALSPISSRPTMIELYFAIREAARKVGAA